ncbi:MAG: helix-turn-helix domain-containing protein [Patescibacteria group bacterium]|nr:helix-turn-helix domain-containing protein [Patescibacteria group bacterium]
MSDNFFYKKLGKKIIKVRERKKISQENLSFSTGLDRTYICRIEKGLANPTLKTIEKIANALKIKLCLLFESI